MKIEELDNSKKKDELSENVLTELVGGTKRKRFFQAKPFKRYKKPTPDIASPEPIIPPSEPESIPFVPPLITPTDNKLPEPAVPTAPEVTVTEPEIVKQKPIEFEPVEPPAEVPIELEPVELPAGGTN